MFGIEKVAEILEAFIVLMLMVIVFVLTGFLTACVVREITLFIIE